MLVKSIEMHDKNHQDNSAKTSSLTSDLQNMRLSSEGGIEDMRGLAEVVRTIDQQSNSRRVSLSPEAERGHSAHGTPRPRRQSRRSSARGDRSQHDVSEEEMPEDAFHSPEFQKALLDAKKLMSRVERVLSSSSVHAEPESTIGKLHEEAVSLASFQYPASRTVGFVGESGVGKCSDIAYELCMN